MGCRSRRASTPQRQDLKMDWWAIPGPRSFLDAVIDDIREGKSVFRIRPSKSILSPTFRVC
jgi:hypothetical protein